MQRNRIAPTEDNLEADRYKALLLEWLDQGVAMFAAALVGLAALLLVCQLLLQYAPARQLLTKVDRLEGFDLNGSRDRHER